MNIQETSAIMEVLHLTYPRFYQNISKEDIVKTINLWAMMFADDDAQLVTEAVKSMIATLKFPPVIADIREKIRLITAQEQMTEMEAWGQVIRAISNANYHAQECFRTLSPTIQKIVGTPQQLREWALMDGDTVQSVIQSNFMRSYKAKKEHENTLNALPESTKAMIQGLADKMKIGGAT